MLLLFVLLQGYTTESTTPLCWTSFSTCNNLKLGFMPKQCINVSISHTLTGSYKRHLIRTALDQAHPKAFCSVKTRSLRKYNLFPAVFLLCIIVNWISLSFGLLDGQNKTSEDVTLDWNVRPIFHCFAAFYTPNDESFNRGNNWQIYSMKHIICFSLTDKQCWEDYSNRLQISVYPVQNGG